MALAPPLTLLGLNDGHDEAGARDVRRCPPLDANQIQIEVAARPGDSAAAPAGEEADGKRGEK